MEDMKSLIIDVLENTKEINWLILHKISEKVLSASNSEIIFQDIEFLYINDQKERNSPFNAKQGLIKLNTEKSQDEFESLIIKATKKFEKNNIALSNLYIIILQIDGFYPNDPKRDKFIEIFKTNIE